MQNTLPKRPVKRRTSRVAGTKQFSKNMHLEDAVPEIRAPVNPDNDENNVENQNIDDVQYVKNPANADAEPPEEPEVLAEVDDEDEAKETSDMIEQSRNMLMKNASNKKMAEAYKKRAAVIFEKKVNDKVRQKVAVITRRLKEEHNRKLRIQKRFMMEKMNQYLDYVVNEWFTENKLAIDQGIRTEVLEEFVTNMKKLFEQSSLIAPKSKIDIAKKYNRKANLMAKRLAEQRRRNAALHKKISQYQIEHVVSRLSRNLTENDKTKFKSLVEELKYRNLSELVQKAKIIHEEYFSNKKINKKQKFSSVITDNPAPLFESMNMSNGMRGYLSILDKIK